MTAQPFALPPRRYQAATAVSCKGGYAVMLDDRRLLTPAQNELLVPTENLAAALATEFAAQEKQINPASMPMTQLAMTAMDRVGPQRDGVITSLTRWLDTELIRHAGADAELAAFQKLRWQGLHDFLQAAYGVTLSMTQSLSAPPVDKLWLENALCNMDNYRLTALQQAASTTGSLVIGLAMLAQQVSVEEAVAAAEAEADWQGQRWGADPSHAARQAVMATELNELARFIGLL